MVIILGVEVEWYLLSSILIYTSVLIPTFRAETMPEYEKSNNKYNHLIFLRIKFKGRFMLDRASFA